MTRRNAFTLVELLVAIVIMVILTTLVLAAFQRDDGDRVAASSRRVQAYLEGARSRAISEKRPVGVRLLPSQTDPNVIDSLQYIGATAPLEDDLLSVRYEAAVSSWVISSSDASFWRRLGQPTPTNPTGRGLIAVGARVEIPAGTGNWYTLSQTLFDPENNILSIAGHYTPSRLVAGVYGALPDPDDDGWAEDVPYRMQFAATALPNAEPIGLERGTVIDLHASGDNAPLEILFDERGVPAGSLAARGLIHLYVTTVADVELTRGMFAGHPANGGSMTPPIVPANAPNCPKTPPAVVTIYAQTGQVGTSDADLTDADMDLQADAPFRMAKRGQEK